MTLVIICIWKMDLQCQGPEAHIVSLGKEMVSGLESQRRMEWRSERKREVIWMNYKDDLLVRKRLSCYSGETPSSSVLNKMEFQKLKV